MFTKHLLASTANMNDPILIQNRPTKSQMNLLLFCQVPTFNMICDSKGALMQRRSYPVRLFCFVFVKGLRDVAKFIGTALRDRLWHRSAKWALQRAQYVSNHG